MSGNEYQKLASRTINKDLAKWEQEDHALHGMVGEIGEIHSMYQKGFQGHTYPAEHYKKEIGDCSGLLQNTAPPRAGSWMKSCR